MNLLLLLGFTTFELELDTLAPLHTSFALLIARPSVLAVPFDSPEHAANMH
jgi:hypothetical protein